MIDNGDEIVFNYKTLPPSNKDFKFPNLGYIIAHKVARDFQDFRIEEFFTLDYIITLTLMKGDEPTPDRVDLIRVREDADGHYICCITFPGVSSEFGYGERLMEITKYRRI